MKKATLYYLVNTTNPSMMGFADNATMYFVVKRDNRAYFYPVVENTLKPWVFHTSTVMSVNKSVDVTYINTRNSKYRLVPAQDGILEQLDEETFIFRPKKCELLSTRIYVESKMYDNGVVNVIRDEENIFDNKTDAEEYFTSESARFKKFAQTYTLGETSGCLTLTKMKWANNVLREECVINNCTL